MLNAEKIIEKLDLIPLEGEGGMIRNTYVCDTKIDGHTCGKAIYYLLTDKSFSHLHKLKYDEMYHFYLGDPVELLILNQDGSGEKITLDRKSVV